MVTPIAGVQRQCEQSLAYPIFPVSWIPIILQSNSTTFPLHFDQSDTEPRLCWFTHASYDDNIDFNALF